MNLIRNDKMKIINGSLINTFNKLSFRKLFQLLRLTSSMLRKLKYIKKVKPFRSLKIKRNLREKRLKKKKKN